jgi:RNA polymerase sigma-70 factor (ECF subfamily)
VTLESPALQLRFEPASMAHPVPFEALVVANQRVIYAVCLRLLRDPCAAEDACQETLIAAWRHREDTALCRSWLIHVAVNKCRDELRRRNRRPPGLCCLDDEDAEAVPSYEPNPESVALSGDSCRTIERALMQLPFGQRVALVLGDVEGWSYREIATATGVSLGTVKSRVFRGRMRLRALLG